MKAIKVIEPFNVEIVDVPKCQPANYNSNRLHFYCKLNSHPTYKGYLNVPYFTARFFLFSL
ncbi:MAG: hypothetical protein PHS82_16820, partial [Lachnospiraceae bacterium]|nr:hypothetical protein [Lachnospiraceae bacterium]